MGEWCRVTITTIDCGRYARIFYWSEEDIKRFDDGILNIQKADRFTVEPDDYSDPNVTIYLNPRHIVSVTLEREYNVDVLLDRKYLFAR